MRVFAYCAASFRDITRKAAGVKPLTSPPTSALSFNPSDLSKHDLIYFDLHGLPGQSYWWGDEKTIALTAMQVREADLRGSIVFALSCYLTDSGSPMLDALLDAGARYVVGGDGQNWAGRRRSMLGAGLLGLWFRRLLAWGVPPLRALAWAKQRVKLSAVKKGKRLAAKDTLEFRMYYRR